MPHVSFKAKAETLRQRSGRRGAGFTLVEMLVAIGAVALVSVGLAAIFQTVGRTVTTGKRVSQLTQQAAILESQMREDFAKMTRDGFLVIRHQFSIDATSRNPQNPGVVSVPRFKDDPVAPRPRRIDELLFFANGEFRSTREQLIPGRSATSRAARIYYGHGMRGAPMASNTTDYNYDYFNPGFDNRMFFGVRPGEPFPPSVLQHRLGGKIPSQYTTPGVNYYASDWTLLRHATLLQRPGSAPSAGWPDNVPRPTTSGSDTQAAGQAGLDRLSADNLYQIAGQPAAPSIFRTITEMLQMNRGTDTTNKSLAMYWPASKNVVGNTIPPIVPRFESGLVEVATTDLDEIALIVNGMGLDAGSVNGNIYASRAGAMFNEAFIPPLFKLVGDLYTYNISPSATSKTGVLRRYFEQQTAADFSSPFNKPLAVMQSWMINALPAPSGYHPTMDIYDSAPPGVGNVIDPSLFRVGARIRYDDKTPDLRGTLDAYTGRDAIIRRTDLLTLGLSRVAAHCTEFVVEWSWGQTYPAGSKDEYQRDVSGQMVWYGRTLQTYTNGVADINTSQTDPSPDVYRYQPLYKNSLLAGKNFSPPLSPVFEPFKGDTSLSSNVQNYQVRDALVHGVRKRKDSGGDHSSLVSYFGYYDPSFIPTPNTNDPPVMPWTWPKMIRVSVTLADANDPSIEQTFQYVFPLPEGPRP
ncbi:MAG: type II secretion system protein [Phycisphaerales bacterium]|nr:hypothetical protein [Planctomycetota bacterium]